MCICKLLLRRDEMPQRVAIERRSTLDASGNITELSFSSVIEQLSREWNQLAYILILGKEA